MLTTEQIPQEIARQIIAQRICDWWQFLSVVNVMLLVAGNFMEPSSIMLILAPILFPSPCSSASIRSISASSWW